MNALFSPPENKGQNAKTRNGGPQTGACSIIPRLLSFNSLSLSLSLYVSLFARDGNMCGREAENIKTERVNHDQSLTDCCTYL